MEFFASFPLTGAKRKTTTLMNEHQKKPKISSCSAASETYNGNENEGDDEVEYYEVVEDEDEDEDGQDGNEDEQQHEKDENEEKGGKAKEYLASQQACAHDFDRAKLHDVQIRSLKDRCAHMQESYRIEQQARMDLQLTVEKLKQTVEKLEKTVQRQGGENKRNEETINECKRRLATLEHKMGVAVRLFEIIWDRVAELPSITVDLDP